MYVVAYCSAKESVERLVCTVHRDVMHLFIDRYRLLIGNDTSTVDDGHHECALICAATIHCPITDTYVRVVPIITDASVCGQFCNGTWIRFQFRASFSSASQG